MSTVKLQPVNLYLLLAVLAVSLALLDFGQLAGEQRGMLLFTLTFWTALVQGMVAAVAVCDLVNARWTDSLRRELLAPHSLLLPLALLFLLLWPLLDLYPWAEAETAWLNPAFFLGRNLALLLAVYAAALFFVPRSLARSESRKRAAVVFIFLFVASQSLVAYDWVMSLAYPWISTLFGAYFFVESLYAGLAMAGVLFGLLYRGKAARDPERAPRHLSDLATLIFGFSVLWGGLFFAQFLLLWYGNLPEEVGFIVRRVSESPFRELAWLFLAANFAVPFFGLMSRRVKRTPTAVAAVAAAILLGLFAERLLFIWPQAPLHFGIVLGESLLLLASLLLIVHSRDELLPGSGAKAEDVRGER